MSLKEFSDDDIEHFRQNVLADPAALRAVVGRLREIALMEGHSYGAVRLASEALRALGANVPLSCSEKLRRAKAQDKTLALMP
ncbi:MAG: hypothetical protein AB7T86_05050 [Xanthobacteraceae bacterium]